MRPAYICLVIIVIAMYSLVFAHIFINGINVSYLALITGDVKTKKDDVNFYVILNNSKIYPGQFLKITVFLYNNGSTIIRGEESNLKIFYPLPNQSKLPFNLAIFKGYYTKYNISYGVPLNIFNFTTNDPKQFSFEILPHSSIIKANNYYENGKTTFIINGYWENGSFKKFSPGVYTIVGSDFLGQLIIKHFYVNEKTF